MSEQIIVQLNPDVPPTGSDLGIVNAARKSFGRRSSWDIELYDDPTRDDYEYCQKSARSVLKDKDKRLLEFLARGMTAADFDKLLYEYNDTDLSKHPELLWQWRNTPTHDTPFNHGFFSFEVKAPIFVARHLVKHEYLIMSEYSRRYITDDVEFYVPKVWREQSSDKKQGSHGEHKLWNRGKGTGYVDEVLEHNQSCVDLYSRMVDMGVSIEQARMVLPQSLMTSWTWSGTLGAFANMCKLRLSKDTQYETRLVAQAVYEELKNQFPVAAPLLVEGVL